MSKPLSDNPAETERVRRLMDRGAPRYDRQMNFFDRVLFTDGREWACSHADGDVLEIAVGSGRKLALCTIPDPGRAVAEAHRVLRPGGRYVGFEHVRSPALAVRSVQRALNPL